MIPTDAVPPVTVRSGGLVVAGMFVVSGFARIFFPHPAPSQPPAQHKAQVAQSQTKAPETEAKTEPYPIELGEKIRESFGCASPENQPTEHPEKNHWNVPENSRGLIRFLFALEPDPAHTHLALLFDRDVEALELAVQRDGSYAFDRSILPWQSSPHSSGKSDESNKGTGAEPRKLEKYPGLLIFRNTKELSSETNHASSPHSCPAKESLFVFLIAETPTSGIRADQFQNALTIMRQIRGRSDVPQKKSQPLLVLGPNFSGSLDSLRRQIQQIPQDLGISDVAVYSGAVTSGDSMGKFREAFPSVAKLPARFESFQENDDYAIQMFTSFAASRGYCSSEIAILTEADTVYGNQQQPSGTSDNHGKENAGENASCRWPIDNSQNAGESNIVHLHFPREISFFRSAYQKELAAQAQNTAKIPSGKSSLPLETDEETNDDDAVSPFARGQMTQSQEAVMLGIVSELQKHHTKFTILLATNPVDEVFLARYLRANYPQGRIVVTSPDLLLMNQDDSLLYGVLGLNDYSLVPGISDSLYQTPDERTAHTDQLFDSSTSVGVFNAATALLFTKPCDPSFSRLAADEGVPGFADYASPGLADPMGLGHRPILWLTILGRDGYWPLAALTDATEHSIVGTSSLPIVPVKTHWHKHSTLPFIDEALDPPDSTPLHTRPAWNITYGLCFVLLVLHAYLSITGSFLSNSESKAQFSRSDDPLSAAVLAIGAFWLSTFFVIVLCTRSLQLNWNNVCPAGVTFLLWTPLPVFIAITAYDLKKRCNKPTIAYGFLAATLLVSIFLIAFSGFIPEMQYVWSSRLIHLTSGVSPVLPFLLLIAAGYCWAWLSLRSVSIVDLRRPRLPNILSLPRSAVRISESEGEAVRATAHPLAIRGRIVGCLIGVLLISISALEWRHPLQSLEGYIYDIGYSIGLAFTIAVFLSCLIRLVFTWFDYKQVLAGLDRTPLREAFSRMKRLSWRSMWNPGGSTLRATYRVMSRILESMNRVKAILSNPSSDKSPEVLDSILATEDRLEDVMNDFYALFPLPPEKESFEELLKDIGDAETKLSETVKTYTPLFPRDARKVGTLPESLHTLKAVQSAHEKVTESWNTYAISLEAAKKIRAAAEKKAAETSSRFQKLVLWLRHLWELLSPAKTVQSNPNLAREVMRQIKTAHTRLETAVNEHDALLAQGQPQEAVSQKAHDSLEKIKAAQSKLIAALDRYAAMFPAPGVRNPRDKVLLNLTTGLGELQQQLANTAGLVYREILTPQWTAEQAPSVSEDERLPKATLEMSRVIEEEFVALVYVNFLQSVLLQMRSLVICAGGMYVLLLCSMSVYPFEPHLALQILSVVLIVIMAGVVGFVYKEMHSDPILSRLTSTTAGVLGWDFWLKFISAGAIPVFSLLAVQFPQIGKFLFSWLEPAMQAVK